MSGLVISLVKRRFRGPRDPPRDQPRDQPRETTPDSPMDSPLNSLASKAVLRVVGVEQQRCNLPIPVHVLLM